MTDKPYLKAVLDRGREIALLDSAGNTAITLTGYCYNLILVTLGNMIGGALLVGVPYFVGSREEKAA